MTVVKGVTQGVGKAGSSNRTPRELRVDEDGRLEIAGRPILSQDATHDRADGATDQTHDIPSSATTIRLPVPGGRYHIKCTDNACYVRWDGGDCTTSVGGFSYHFAEGVPEVFEFPREVDELSIIGTVAAGHISLLLLRRD